jgi:hypothetical protein
VYDSFVGVGDSNSKFHTLNSWDKRMELSRKIRLEVSGRFVDVIVGVRLKAVCILPV